MQIACRLNFLLPRLHNVFLYTAILNFIYIGVVTGSTTDELLDDSLLLFAHRFVRSNFHHFFNWIGALMESYCRAAHWNRALRLRLCHIITSLAISAAAPARHHGASRQHRLRTLKPLTSFMWILQQEFEVFESVKLLRVQLELRMHLLDLFQTCLLLWALQCVLGACGYFEISRFLHEFSKHLILQYHLIKELQLFKVFDRISSTRRIDYFGYWNVPDLCQVLVCFPDTTWNVLESHTRVPLVRFDAQEPFTVAYLLLRELDLSSFNEFSFHARIGQMLIPNGWTDERFFLLNRLQSDRSRLGPVNVIDTWFERKLPRWFDNHAGRV